MIAWSCEHCSAEVKQDKEPEFCPICKKRGNWIKINYPDPTEQEKEFTKKYEEVIKTIEKYEEGTPPRKLIDAGCSCGDEETHLKKRKEDD